MDEPADVDDAIGTVRIADLLLILPFVWQLALAPWANGVTWAPFGLPFPMAWQMAGIVFATVVLWLRYRIDHGARAGTDGGAA